MQDFTRTIITENDKRDIVKEIFVDAVVLKAPYTIISVGENLSNLLGLAPGELEGKPLSEFSRQMPSKNTLTRLLRPGFFTKYKTTMESQAGHRLECILSAFYLGIIGDFTDIIILNIKPARLITESCSTIQLRANELDDFIYAASHDLRGPLATIKGLINLMNLPGENDYRFFLEKIAWFVESLDDRLHKLMYFAESDKGAEFSEQLSLDEILHRLNLSTDPQHPTRKIQAVFVDPCPMDKLNDGKLLLALFHNIRQFFIRNCNHNSQLELRASETDTNVKFVLTASDFLLTPEQRQNFEVINFGYTEILSNPQFTEIYSAKKIILRLQGSLYLETSDRRVSACISIPRS